MKKLTPKQIIDKFTQTYADLYQDMLRNLNDGVELQVRADASQLVSEYGSTAYGDAALLMLANRQRR